MSPTSYQAAPPRGSARILTARPPESRPHALRTGPPAAARAGVGRRPREAVQQLLVAAHHPELLARDPLLHRGVARQRLLPEPERVHLALQARDGGPEESLHRITRSPALRATATGGRHAVARP